VTKIVAYMYVCVELSGKANAVVVYHSISVLNCRVKKVHLSFFDHKKRPCQIVEFRNRDPLSCGTMYRGQSLSSWHVKDSRMAKKTRHSGLQASMLSIGRGSVCVCITWMAPRGLRTGH
jgi:hypothetical protein